MRAARWLALSISLLTGCDAGASTLIVQVRTDVLPGREMATVRVRLDREGGTPEELSVDADVSESWGAGVRIAEVPMLAAGFHTMVVGAYAENGTPVVERPVRVQLDGGVRIVTVLLTRDCLGVLCPDPGGDPEATACLAGRCVTRECSEETPEMCGARECTADLACPATSACAMPRCTASGSCVSEPDHLACATGEVCHPDSGCVPADCGSVCELHLAQCGCAEGEGCYTTDGTNRICSLAGTVREGEACVTDVDCEPGHGCFGVEREVAFVCRRFCRGPSECPAPHRCVDLGVAGLRACLDEGCDPVADSGCAPGRTCSYDVPDAGGSLTTTCRAVGTGNDGDPCSQILDCGAGLFCTQFNARAEGICRPYCDDSTDCGDLSNCVAVPAIVGSGLGQCDAGCDPFTGDGCTAGSCLLVGTVDVGGVPAGVTICGLAGSTPVGMPCSPGECVAGSVCTGTPTVCSQLCDVETNDCLLLTCTPTTPPTMLGARGSEVGACL